MDVRYSERYLRMTCEARCARHGALSPKHLVSTHLVKLTRLNQPACKLHSSGNQAFEAMRMTRDVFPFDLKSKSLAKVLGSWEAAVLPGGSPYLQPRICSLRSMYSLHILDSAVKPKLHVTIVAITTPAITYHIKDACRKPGNLKVSSAKDKPFE